MTGRALLESHAAPWCITAIAGLASITGCASAARTAAVQRAHENIQPLSLSNVRLIPTANQPALSGQLRGALRLGARAQLGPARASDGTASVRLTPGDGRTTARVSPVDSASATARAQAGVVEFAFGDSEPIVRCTVLRVCVIELEPGESLADEPIAGDQERWVITQARAGRGGANTLVIVKPKACDIATNVVLSTDRRIYNLDLEAPPCRPRDTNPKQPFTRHVRFSYAGDTGRTHLVSDRSTASRDPEPKDTVGAGSGSTILAAPAINRAYRVVRARRGPFGAFGRKPLEFPWTPATVSDDGAHVYITLPHAARQHAAPVLYALEDDGTRTMMNFIMQDSVIVTDRVFRRGLFVIVSGNREQTLTIENRAWGASPSGARRK